MRNERENKIAAKCGTDKGSIQTDASTLSPKGYLDFYLPMMRKIVQRNGVIRILELGVWKGASLRLWRELFGGAAVLTGLDLRKCDSPDYANALMFQGDQGKHEDLSRVATAGPFDVIIDDGGHRHDLHRASFNALWFMVAEGGFYAIEDLHVDGHITIPWLKSVSTEFQKANVRHHLEHHPSLSIMRKRYQGPPTPSIEDLRFARMDEEDRLGLDPGALNDDPRFRPEWV